MSNKKPSDGLAFTEQLMYTTVRLAVEGSGNSWSGTGFVVKLDVDSPIGKFPCYIVVTNKHVTNNAECIEFHLTSQKNGVAEKPKKYRIENASEWIVDHPDNNVDLAVVSLFPIIEEITTSSETPFFVSLKPEELATETDLEWLAPGMPVVMIGYPNGLSDEVNNLPLFRSGIAATHGGVKFNGKDEFVVDMACFPGSSGSPVWFIAVGSYTNKFGHVTVGTSTGRLMGVLYSGPLINADGSVQAPDGTAMSATTPMMMNLGYVIRATRILDFQPILAQRYVEWLQKMMDMLTEKGLLEQLIASRNAQTTAVPPHAASGDSGSVA